MAVGYLGVEATPENCAKFDALFKCQRCKPSCCEGSLFKGALIFPQEIERLAIEAGISKHQFKDRHTYAENGQRFLKLPCLFYKDGCTIYKDRPRICREFPLNATYRKDGKVWMTVGMRCPAGKELGDKYAVKVQV